MRQGIVKILVLNGSQKREKAIWESEIRGTMNEIRTERLFLRYFRESDYDDLFEFLSQLENDEFEGYPGITYDNGRMHLEYRISSNEFYAVELTGSGKVIGNIYCGSRDFEANEVGYIINRQYQRKGYATEALSAVIKNTFLCGTHRVFAECDPRNVGSWKLLEKVGMRREAHFRQNIFFHKDRNGDPVWKDTFVYAMLGCDHASLCSCEYDKFSMEHMGTGTMLLRS